MTASQLCIVLSRLLSTKPPNPLVVRVEQLDSIEALEAVEVNQVRLKVSLGV